MTERYLARTTLCRRNQRSTSWPWHRRESGQRTYAKPGGWTRLILNDPAGRIPLRQLVVLYETAASTDSSKSIVGECTGTTRHQI